jgi:hypothetical protein
VRGGDFSCKAETCRARWRLVVPHRDLLHKVKTCRARRRLVARGRYLSCKADTCRGGPCSGELVGDAANYLKTKHLASVGLDQGPYSTLS